MDSLASAIPTPIHLSRLSAQTDVRASYDYLKVPLRYLSTAGLRKL